MTRRRQTARRGAPPLAWAGLLLAAGCGYTAGFDLSAEGVHTVGIEVVGNQSFRQRLEVPLTRRLLEELPAHTGLRLAAPERADAVLTVELRAVRGQSLVQGDRSRPVQEGALQFVAEVRLRDRGGRVLRRTQISDTAEFRTAIGETEQSAAAEAARDLARKIALALEPAF